MRAVVTGRILRREARLAWRGGPRGPRPLGGPVRAAGEACESRGVAGPRTGRGACGASAHSGPDEPERGEGGAAGKTARTDVRMAVRSERELTRNPEIT